MSTKKIVIYLLPFFLTTTLSAQLSVSFATWKDNCKGAYSIIHDDFGIPGYTNGIQDYADTIAFSNNVKISFGPITGSCNNASWLAARKMLTHGHEILNHTHSHKCAIPQSWCTNGSYTNADFPIELDSSTALITRNTYTRPLFFIYPYDQFNDDIQSHVKALGYIGTRTGVNGDNLPIYFDRYSINFRVLQPDQDQRILTAQLDAAVSNGTYIMHELHGVSDLSWSSVKLDEYINHIKHVKELQDKNYVWCATPTEVISYREQYKAYEPSVSYNTQSGDITVSFNAKSAIDTTFLRTPLTVMLKLDTIKSAYTITQKGVVNTVLNDYSKHSDTLLINVYPHKGNTILLTRNAAANYPPSVSFIAPAMNLTIDANAGIRFKINASDVDGTIAAVSLYDNGTLVGTLNQAPYTFNWPGASSGVHELKVKAVDNKGAEGFAALYFTIPGTSSVLANKQSLQLANVSLYPNPLITKSELHYTLLQAATILKLKITNTLGVLIYEKNLPGSAPGNYTYSIDGTSFKPGVYFIQLEVNQLIYPLKFMKPY